MTEPETAEPQIKSLLEQIMARAHTPKFELRYEDGRWSCDLEHDRITVCGTGETAEEALVEALVDRVVGDHFYAGGDEVSQERLVEWHRSLYQGYLGQLPEHTYRGEYLRKNAGNPVTGQP